MKDIEKLVGKIVRHKKTRSVGRCTSVYPRCNKWIVVDWVEKGESWPGSYMTRPNNVEVVRGRKTNGIKEKVER